VRFAWLVWKDARRETRTKEGILAGSVLVLLFLVLYVFAYKATPGPAAATAALWAPLLFGTAALVGRGMASEADRGTLDLLRALPHPLAWHGWSRTLLHAALLALLAAATLLGVTALLGTSANAALAWCLALAIPGLAVVGTLASAIAAQARGREMLLPLLMVPVLAPFLHAGIEATMLAVAGSDLAAASVPLLLMAGYDLLAVGAAWLLWPIVLEGD
jgi:heme exporter protein B